MNIWTVAKDISINRIEKKIQRETRNQKIKRFKKQGDTYCIVHRTAKHAAEGLFSSYLGVIKMIHIALDEGLIPVVDMQTEPNPYLRADEVGRLNAWEYYFKQPCGAGLKDIVGKPCVDLYEPPDGCYPDDSMEFLTNPVEVSYWREFSKKYIPYSDRSLKYMKKYEDIRRQIMSHRTLGLFLRGTDYMGMRPENHCIVPSIQESMREVKLLMKKYDLEKIFLSVEDNSIMEAYKDEFGDRLLYIGQKRYDNPGNRNLFTTEEFLKTDARRAGMEYLASIWLIASCNVLFAARSSGSVGCQLLSDGYEKEIFWNSGRYRMNHLNLLGE